MESPANSDNLFNLELVCTATVDIVLYSGEGGEEGLVDRLVVGEWDRCPHPTEWFCPNWGTCTYGWGYRWDVFLVGVIELTGSRLIWVWEVFIPNMVERSRGRDQCAYWTCGNMLRHGRDVHPTWVKSLYRDTGFEGSDFKY